MQSDTISRSALVAELEAFKMSMGDIVLRFIVDRVIERVKAQPGVEAQSEGQHLSERRHLSEVQLREGRHCIVCKYAKLLHTVEPCMSCIASGCKRYWEPRP